MFRKRAKLMAAVAGFTSMGLGLSFTEPPLAFARWAEAPTPPSGGPGDQPPTQESEQVDPPEETEGEGGQQPKPERKFTQEDMNRTLAAERRKLTAAAKADKEALAKAQKELADAKASLDDGGKPRGETELAVTRLQRRVEELEQSNAAVAQECDLERSLRRQGERDRLLNEALVAARCVNMLQGQRYFLPQIEFDADAEEWVFKTAKGNYVSIADGVNEEMPTNLRQASTISGGSGTRQGGVVGAAKVKELDAAKAELQRLSQVAMQTGRDTDRAAYAKQKRKVAELEQTRPS